MPCGCAGGPQSLNSFGCCCVCNELPPTREEGPPGPAGADGGVPVFTVGTVTTGSPSVTLTQVTPLEYTIDFVLPNVPTSSPNTWSATQTFTVQAVFNGGLAANGPVQINSTLGVTGVSTLEDANLSGDLSVDGGTTLATLDTTGNANVGGNLSVTGTTSFGGAVSFTVPPNLGIVALTANENARGFLVLDHNNVVKFVPNFGYTQRGQADGTVIAPVVPGDINIAVVDPLVITVPVLTPNQPTPTVDVEATLTIDAGNATAPIQLQMWFGAIGVGSPVDFVEFDIGGSWSQVTLRKCNQVLALGANNFRISGDNDAGNGNNLVISRIVWRVRE